MSVIGIIAGISSVTSAVGGFIKSDTGQRLIGGLTSIIGMFNGGDSGTAQEQIADFKAQVGEMQFNSVKQMVLSESPTELVEFSVLSGTALDVLAEEYATMIIQGKTDVEINAQLQIGVDALKTPQVVVPNVDVTRMTGDGYTASSAPLGATPNPTPYTNTAKPTFMESVKGYWKKAKDFWNGLPTWVKWLVGLLVPFGLVIWSGYTLFSTKRGKKKKFFGKWRK